MSETIQKLADSSVFSSEHMQAFRDTLKAWEVEITEPVDLIPGLTARRISRQGKNLKMVWNTTAPQELVRYHGVSAVEEFIEAFLDQVFTNLVKEFGEDPEHLKNLARPHYPKVDSFTV